ASNAFRTLKEEGYVDMYNSSSGLSQDQYYAALCRHQGSAPRLYRAQGTAAWRPVADGTGIDEEVRGKPDHHHTGSPRPRGRRPGGPPTGRWDIRSQI